MTEAFHPERSLAPFPSLVEQLDQLRALAECGETGKMTKDLFPSVSPGVFTVHRFIGHTKMIQALVQVRQEVSDPRIQQTLTRDIEEKINSRDRELAEYLRVLAPEKSPFQIKNPTAEQLQTITLYIQLGLTERITVNTFPFLSDEEAVFLQQQAAMTHLKVEEGRKGYLHKVHFTE